MYRSTQAIHMLTKPQVFYDDTYKQALGYQNLFNLKKAQRIQPTLYDGSVIVKEYVVISMIDDEEILILEEKRRSKMLDKQNDPILIEKKIKISPIDYLKLNKIKKDFGKRFVTQKELSAEQAFWLKHSSLSETPVKSHTPVRVEAPSELPKGLKKEREHLKSIYKDQFDSIRKTRVQSKEHCDSLIAQFNAKSVENSDLNAQLQEKVFTIAALKNELKKLKGKNVVDIAISKPSAAIALGMFKLDIEPISHILKNNRDAHEFYIEKTIENTNTLHGFIEHARTQNPSEPLLESACMFTKHIQELSSPRSYKLKYQKDHLCSACALSKSKKHSHKPKAEDSIQEKHYVLHMDLCRPMRVQSINGRKYILVIVDDFPQFTWVKFLRSKDEVPEFIIKFLKMIQVRLNAIVRNIRTYNGIEFVNQTLKSYYEEVGISHQTFVAHTPQQNSVVERRNRTLVEAARTMLIFLKALLFL
ncbi:retrovirus-related pol polyprotein from transposon TNT 1-94 [Tanacetum coccineum]